MLQGSLQGAERESELCLIGCQRPVYSRKWKHFHLEAVSQLVKENEEVSLSIVQEKAV